MLEERIFWLAWSQVRGLGPVLQKRLATYYGSLETAWYTPPQALQAVEGIGPKLVAAIAQQRRHLSVEQLQPPTSPYITPADSAYPTLLYEIPDPPPVLYYQGQLDLLQACLVRPGAAIVGTRRPSEYGKRWTRQLATALSGAHIPIISGLADGIDRVAHHSCLTSGGQTIAILGTGVDVFYPHRNRELQQAIAQAGLLLSEHPPGTPPDRAHFPRRNRIIAGLSRAVLVTEAPHKSGALITARLANDYGREVFILPGSLDNPNAHGCLELIAQGAQLILGTDQLVTALGGIPVEAAPNHSTADPVSALNLAPELLQVLQAVAEEPTTIDSIAQSLGSLATGDLLSTLTHLELMGLISALPGTQQYQRCCSLLGG